MNKEQSLPETKRKVEKWFTSDLQFNRLYPLAIQDLARRHWTPLIVAKKAASFLATKNNVRIADIGSGVGKFCLAAAFYQPSAFYFGIEQRRSLFNQGEIAKKILQMDNVSFHHGNFTQLHLRHYDHFYLYNPFYENLTGTDKIDDSIDYSEELFNYYNRYLRTQLEQRPAGTRLVTYHSLEDEIPDSFHVVGADMNELLKFWVKI